MYFTEDDTLSWLSDEESSSESTVAAPPTKMVRKLQPAATTTMSASLKVPSKKEGNGPTPCRDGKSPIASKQLPQKSSRTIVSKPQVTAMEVTHTPITPAPLSLVIRIPLPLVKQQQQQAAATPTATTVAKKTLGSGSSSLSSSDLSDSDSDTANPTTTATATVVESIRKTILRVPQSTSLSSVKTTIVTKQPSTITTATTETGVTKATTISQVMSKPTLTIPSQQILLKPLTGKNATSNISQRLANIYSPTQVKAFQLSKTVTSPKTTTGGTLPFAAFTWSNRTTTSNTTTVETSSNNTGFTLLSPSNTSKLQQLPFTSLTSTQTGAFRVIAQTTLVNTTNNDTLQQSTTQQ